MDLTKANLIVGVTPDSFSNNALTNMPIVVTFVRDMNASTFSDATVALEVVGTVLRVPVTFAYASRLLTITPTGGLLPGTAYQLTLVGDQNPTIDGNTTHISGILDILGNGMNGIFTSTFITGTTAVPGVTTLQLPVSQSSILTQPTFSWQLIPADSFQIEVSLSNDFENIYWPISSDSVPLITTSTVTPARAFALNTEYWWRVRAMSGTTPGPWSAESNFYFGNPSQGVVTSQDLPLGFPAVPAPVTVYSASPAPGTANLQINPASIMVTLAGTVSLAGITDASLTITSDAVDGEWNAQSSVPMFSPSLNGSMIGGGGIDYPLQVDRYQQIVVSGPFTTGTVVAVAVGPHTQISLPVVSTYWQPNNIYTITLDIAELAAPLTWTFTTNYSPIFSSVRSVREWIDDLFLNAPVSDDDILYKIRHNSLYALLVQVYPPTQLDGESWIYDPPVSFDVNNPPFFVRKYVELKTAHDFLKKKFFGLIGAGGRTTLGDFTVDKSSMAIQGQIQLAFKTLETEILPYIDKLHGLTNRGYARGQWAIRGSGLRGGQNTPGGHIANDNSYLWPRSSRRQF